MNTEVRDSHTIAIGPHHHGALRHAHLDRTAISPYDCYCDGYGMPGAYGNGYVNILKVSSGVVDKTDDALIDGIVTYDKAECADAYVGQINMLTASSFCGIMGQIWGHDLAVHDDIRNNRITPLFTARQFNGSELPVYDAKPLIDAGIELFGTDQERRYHPAPGAHVICANKGVTAYRPKNDRALEEGEGYGVWSFIAISLSNDRDYCADLFIEDAGVWTENDNEDDLKAYLDQHRKEIVWSVVECGRDSGVLFERTYVGYSYKMMKPNQIGNAITVGPYVTLARNAVPDAGFSALNSMTINEWLQTQGFASLTGLQ
ncbi:histidine decarboxylase, pyruvoyl type [Bifidobacterium gallicum]|uniref:Histidine decarboxylase proenzyme n=1 Tax=Bifidobacterium gallicum DSM 20093 = LMG 11596 TaxID=561180 RepID=D1NUP6_9BIFI|nr:histidine decarboxylase, pyruvoyl type [Bifidobacterium gallicum]EFA22547.1 histidine decarboxylase, pyruvoyl type [Bifidobacterium gallicum DSM 20093 = LMG 11596]KFI59537.1 histidine decarboxylase [Bifidobacterium gallicum DSM 20093 = LMG 11596]